MNSLKQRRFGLVLFGSLVGLSGLVQAQTASTPLRLGLWSTEYRVLLNSEDSSTLVQKANADMLKLLPANMRTNATATFDSVRTRGNTKTCITSQNVATASTPSALFANFSKLNPLCRLTATTSSATQVAFSGRCDDPQSFVGNVTGKLTVSSAVLWSVDFYGAGKVPAAAVKALELPAGTPVLMRSFATSRWASATCS